MTLKKTFSCFAAVVEKSGLNRNRKNISIKSVACKNSESIISHPHFITQGEIKQHLGLTMAEVEQMAESRPKKVITLTTEVYPASFF